LHRLLDPHHLHQRTAGAVGFETIGEQVQRKLLKRGFEFNVMVVGESGLGKSTLLDTLFNVS
jgi:septin 3/9/12